MAESTILDFGFVRIKMVRQQTTTQGCSMIFHRCGCALPLGFSILTLCRARCVLVLVLFDYIFSVGVDEYE